MKEQYEQLALAPTSQAAFTAMLSSYKRFLKNKQTKKSLKLNKQKSKKHNLKKKGGEVAIHVNGAGHTLKRHCPALHKAQTQDARVLFPSPGHVQTV